MLQFDAQMTDLIGGFDEGSADVMVSDDAEFKRDFCLSSISNGGGNARIGNRNDKVGVDVAFTGKFRTDFLSYLIDVASFHHAVGSGEIDVLKNTEFLFLLGKGFDTADSVIVDDDDFAGINITNIFRSDDIQGAGFRAQDMGPIDMAQHQGTNTDGVADTDQ